MIDKLLIQIPIYEARIWVYRYESKDDFVNLGKYTEGYHKRNVTENQDYGDGGCIPFSGRAIIWFKKDRHGHIAHEVFHACMSIGNEYGFKIAEIDQEPMAYLIGYVTDKIYNSKYKAVEND